MFEAKTYIRRREKLKKHINNGLLLFLGHDELPMNYPDNTYKFRQNSTFLYFFGLDKPGLAAVIDLDSGEEILFGDDLEVDDIVWMGPQPTMREMGALVGVANTQPYGNLAEVIKKAKSQGREIHFLPEFTAENKIKLFNLLGINPADIKNGASKEFIKGVVALRSVKAEEEIAEIEEAHLITYEMHTRAMRLAKPGRMEQHITGIVEGIPISYGGYISFPVILSRNGAILHNHFHGNELRDGDLMILDSGAENSSHYAADITRVTPVNGKFSPLQREVYEIVLKAEEEGIQSVAPGVSYREVHLKAARIITEGLRAMGNMKGNVDDSVAAGAHALFFPHGHGHMLGLDVHDMEDLGEDYVGYDNTVKRSEQFGLAYLRLAKKLEPGYVLTVEPGIYFMRELTDLWKAEKRHQDFINYDEVEKMIGFGGIRIEDDVLVTETGYRVIGENEIPKKPDEVETTWAEGLE
jgi:Xaa-Pro aminopeptidase